jgi:hypothetical protein
MIFEASDIIDMRHVIFLCRQFRKEGVYRRDYSLEIFAEQQLQSARRKYRAAVQSQREVRL